jgi:hypothetical protein
LSLLKDDDDMSVITFMGGKSLNSHMKHL